MKIATGRYEAAADILEEFRARSVKIVAGAAMGADQGNLREDTLNLADLKVDLHNDQPEREG